MKKNYDPMKQGARKVYQGIPIVHGKCRRCGRAVSGAYHAPMTCGNCRDTILTRARSIQRKAGGTLTVKELRDEVRDQRKYHND